MAAYASRLALLQYIKIETMKFRLTDNMDRWLLPNKKDDQEPRYGTPEAYNRRFNYTKLQVALWFEARPDEAFCRTQVGRRTGVYKGLIKKVVASLHADRTIYIAGWSTKGNTGPLYRWNDDPSSTECRDVPNHAPMEVGYYTAAAAAARVENRGLKPGPIDDRDTGSNAERASKQLREPLTDWEYEAIRGPGTRSPNGRTGYQAELLLTLIALLCLKSKGLATVRTLARQRAMILGRGSSPSTPTPTPAPTPASAARAERQRGTGSYMSVSRHLRVLVAEKLVKIVGQAHSGLGPSGKGSPTIVYEADLEVIRSRTGLTPGSELVSLQETLRLTKTNRSMLLMESGLPWFPFPKAAEDDHHPTARSMKSSLPASVMGGRYFRLVRLPVQGSLYEAEDQDPLLGGQSTWRDIVVEVKTRLQPGPPWPYKSGSAALALRG